MQIITVPRISFIVFIITLAVISIYVVSLVFPAFIITSVESMNQDERFVLGENARPFIITNMILFAIGVFIYLKIIPLKITNAVKFLVSFEVSKRIAVICMIVLIAVYVIFSIEKLGEDELERFADYDNIVNWIEKFPLTDITLEDERSLRFVKNFLGHISFVVFQNVKIIPFMASIAILIITYLFTLHLTQKRLPGLIAVIILLQSPAFRFYDTSVTYDNFWVLFYLFSLYIVSKKWYISPIGFLLGIFSKGVIVLFLPITIYQMIRFKLPRYQIGLSLIFYGSIIAILAGMFLGGAQLVGKQGPVFSLNDFLITFTTLSYQLRFDSIILWFILPLTVALYYISRKGNNFADFGLVMILSSLLISPVLAGLTSFDIHPYRYIPYLVFFAIGAGFLFSRNHKTGWSILTS